MASSTDSKMIRVFLDHPTEEQQMQLLHANSEEWKGALSLESYLRREKLLAQQDLTRDGGITFWSFMGSTASGQTELLAGCETLLKRALVSHQGHVEDAVCHGVASVYALNQWRGKGYGAQMIRALAEALPAWRSGQGQRSFSVLFSDIGKTFYAKHGWMPYPSAHMLLQPLSRPKIGQAYGSGGMQSAKSRTGRTATTIPDLPLATHVTAEMLGELCGVDEILLRARMAEKSKTDAPAVAIIPDARTMLWHHAREDFVAAEVTGKAPAVKGAIAYIPAVSAHANPSSLVEESAAEASSPNQAKIGTRRCWAIWTRTFHNSDPNNSKGNTLHVLRICIEPEPSNPGARASPREVSDEAETLALMALLREAQYQAHEWHMEQVEVWNPSARIITAIQKLSSDDASGFNNEERPPVGSTTPGASPDKFGALHNRENESITSLLWLGGSGIVGAGSEIAPSTIEWIDNEKYGWC